MRNSIKRSLVILTAAVIFAISADGSAQTAVTPLPSSVAQPPASKPATPPVPAKAETSAGPANPMDAFAWMIGGTWTADVSEIMPGTQRIETQYSLSDNGSFLRFTTHFIKAEGIVKNYDGNIYWDQQEKTYRIWYTAASGAITTGPIVLNGKSWQVDFAGADFDDHPAELRAIVDHQSPDLYHWSLSKKDGDSWNPMLALNYLRK